MYIKFLILVALLFVGCSQKTEPTSASVPTIVTLDGVDFMGGDIKHLKTPGGFAECAKACETNPKCYAYTYAKPDHPKAKKHNSCWLKKNGFRYNRGPHYVSGIRP